MKRGSAAKLRPSLGQGASLGEEAVLPDSGRAGEVAAGVGRVRSLAFVSILRAVVQVGELLKYWHVHIGIPQPAN